MIKTEIICDRCGNLIPEKGMKLNSRDLCRECYNALNIFMSELKPFTVIENRCPSHTVTVEEIAKCIQDERHNLNSGWVAWDCLSFAIQETLTKAAAAMLAKWFPDHLAKPSDELP